MVALVGLGRLCSRRTDRSVAAAELTGDREDGLLPLIAGCGGSRGMARGRMRVWSSSGSLFIAVEVGSTAVEDKIGGEPTFFCW